MIQPLKRGQTAQTGAENNAQVRATVADILASIEQRGDTAVRESSQKFDHGSPAIFRLGAKPIAPSKPRPE